VQALVGQLDELRRRERDARAGAAFSVERKEALQEELDRMRAVNRQPGGGPPGWQG